MSNRERDSRDLCWPGDSSVSPYLLLLVLALFVAAGVAAPIHAAELGFQRVTLEGSHTDQQFVAGGQVRVEATIADDLFVAGGQVVVEGGSAEDVIAAGGSLRLRQVEAHDVIAAGGHVDIAGVITDDLVAAGGALYLGREGDVTGDAWLAGGSLDIEGRIGGKLTAGAGSVRLAGTIEGDVDIAAATIVVAPGARLGGNLVYRSREEAEIAPDAEIAGEVRRIEMETGALAGPTWRWLAFGIGAWLGVVVALILAGAVVQAAFPGLMGASVATARAKPWQSLGLGFAVLVAVPVSVGILMATVLGIPLGILVLASYVVALGLGLVVAAFWTGGLILRWIGSRQIEPTLGRRIGATALGLILLALVGLVPFIGFLGVIVWLVFGLGALTNEAWARLRTPAVSG